jgi:hypothetical protein
VSTWGEQPVRAFPGDRAALAAGRRRTRPSKAWCIALVTGMKMSAPPVPPGHNVMVLELDPAFDAYSAERLRTADTLLLGSTSFEGFKAAGPRWPTTPIAVDRNATGGVTARQRDRRPCSRRDSRSRRCVTT